jgi:hypothetical protein
VVERRVRTYKRWYVGVGASGGKPGRCARVWRSLDVDQFAYVELAKRGKDDNNNEKDFRDGRSGEVWRWGVPEDQSSPKSPVRRV